MLDHLGDDIIASTRIFSLGFPNIQLTVDMSPVRAPEDTKKFEISGEGFAVSGSDEYPRRELRAAFEILVEWIGKVTEGRVPPRLLKAHIETLPRIASLVLKAYEASERIPVVCEPCRH